MFNRRQKDFLGCLRVVMGTPDGQKLIKYLKETYMDDSAVRETVEQTYYKLGQKELIQALLAESKLKEEDLESIRTIQMDEDY